MTTLSQSIDNPPFCPQRQTADSGILLNFEAMPLGEKAKAAYAWPLRAASLKRQAAYRQATCSLKAA